MTTSSPHNVHRTRVARLGIRTFPSYERLLSLLGLAVLTACSSTEHGVPDASPHGATRCEIATAPSFCADTFDTQIAAVMNRCESNPATRTCGSHLVVQETATGQFLDRACFYDATSKARVGSVDCSGDSTLFCDNTSPCIYTGAVIESGCDIPISGTSPELAPVCGADGGRPDGA